MLITLRKQKTRCSEIFADPTWELYGTTTNPPSPNLCCTINEKFLKSRTGELVSLVVKIPTLKLKIRNDSPKSVENHTIATKMCCRVFLVTRKKHMGSAFFDSFGLFSHPFTFHPRKDDL